MLLLLLVGCASAAVYYIEPGACRNDSLSNDTYCANGANATTMWANSSRTICNATVQCLANSTTAYVNVTSCPSTETTIAPGATQTINNQTVHCTAPANYCYQNISMTMGSGIFFNQACNIVIYPNTSTSSCSLTGTTQYITPQTYAQDMSVCGVAIHTYAISSSYCSSYGTSTCSSLQSNYESCMSSYNSCTANYNSCISDLNSAKSGKASAESERDATKVQFGTLSSIINSTKDELKACRNASLSTVGLNCKNAILPVCTDTISVLCSADEISKNDLPACIQRIKSENNQSLMSCEIDSKSCSDSLKAYQQGDQNNSNLENIIAMVAGTLIIILGGGALVVVYLKRKSMRDEIR